MMANRAERAHPRPTHLKKPQRGQRQRAHNSAVIWPHDLPLLLSHWPNNCYTLCYATSRPPIIGIRTWASGKQLISQEFIWNCVFQISTIVHFIPLTLSNLTFFPKTRCHDFPNDRLFCVSYENRCDLLSHFKKEHFVSDCP